MKQAFEFLKPLLTFVAFLKPRRGALCRGEAKVEASFEEINLLRLKRKNPWHDNR